MKGSNYLISYTWSCGGTIINQKTILTAAHCIHDKSFEYHDADENYYTLQIQWNEWYNDVESTLEIHVGAHDIKSLEPSKRYRVRKVTKVFTQYYYINQYRVDQASYQHFLI